MAAKLRVGVAGLVHDHIWGLLQQFQKLDNVELAAAADFNEPLLNKLESDFGVSQSYRDPDEMIEKEKLDAVVCGRENSGHAEVAELCAERGVHFMVEKPMSARLLDADRMLAAQRKSGIVMFINYPTSWDPKLNLAYQLVQDGRIGTVYQLRMHCAHGGPREVGCTEYFWSWLYDKQRNGAGALMDYCCYGANINRWFLGQPEAVTGMAGRLIKDYLPKDVDDNAILLLRYPHAISLCEASWTQIGDIPYGFIINGSAGTIVPKKGGLLLTTGAPGQASKDEMLEAPPLPPDRSNGPTYFVNCIVRGEQPEGPSSAQVCRDAQEILEAGILSAERGREIRLPVKA
jgi:predicted dehydrogenase